MTKITTDVVYDHQKNLTVDIYAPTADTAPSKVLVFWHGGGWFRGDKDSLRDLCTRIADQGFTVFAPNYSLAPANRFPAAHQDCVRFVEWLLASKYVDNDHHPRAITQIGASSGGVMALYLAGRYGFPTVTWSAPVNYSDWMRDHEDVKPSADAQNELGVRDPSDINKAFYKYFALTYAGANDAKIFARLDAKSYDYHKLHQLLMINSTRELSPLKYLLDFVDTLAGENHGVDLKIIPGSRHAMSYADQYLPQTLAYLSSAI